MQRRAMHNFVFVALLMGFLVLGRCLGWSVAQGFLYDLPNIFAMLCCVTWGVAVALAANELLVQTHASSPLKFVIGVSIAAYVSIPNHGLMNENEVPEYKRERHRAIHWVSLSSFYACALLIAVLR